MVKAPRRRVGSRSLGQNFLVDRNILDVIERLASLSADDVVLEDWKGAKGAVGIPPDWKGQSWGSPKYEFTVVEDEGRPALRMKSANEGSTISKEIRASICSWCSRR